MTYYTHYYEAKDNDILAVSHMLRSTESSIGTWAVVWIDGLTILIVTKDDTIILRLLGKNQFAALVAYALDLFEEGFVTCVVPL